ncbi:carbohydrate ABC transporter membrane protein 2 (CUT1 family) [Halanaerobium sp. ST460_2HS_T2]|jgi:putative aldouronate transport system permease protein|uniref:Carbohydrate ABC transporter membrane protein 2 (CUT1 family) n=2 Tax=Halanaerobiaceae TaxID=972 RepID=A0A1G6KKG9_9FIRM|nr:carbohydrate ABC transporter membrane protein 2 (CUT1 family) [Halanaerobium congolense]RCW61006.1 carbohydrate ABC transporter membrane protein 2 (CUT1 family) [Halanaerobium sp. ST460_2HS_T2]SDC31454.1 carbohydrate ABC transporter membrane protein 2, CUT1 family [Halanaerobium congolense]
MMTKRKFTVVDIIILILLTIFGLAVLYPFYNAILVSLVPQHVYAESPFMLWPDEITLDAYKQVFNDQTLINGMKTTVIVTFLGTVYNMLITILTSYALTKDIPGRKFINYLILFTMFFSGGLIPYYLLIKNLGLINNILVMVLPMGFNIMYMIVLRSFFNDIPDALEESAKIDGANDFIILFKIILPLSLPILATLSLYYGVNRWNEWYHGMLFINSPDIMPLQLVLRNIVQDASKFLQGNTAAMANVETFSEGIQMASVVTTMFPIMMLYPFLQRYFLSGLTLGAVKS